MEKTKNVRNENINELIELLYAHLRELEYSEATIMTNKSILGRLEQYAESNGKTEFTIELGRDFVHDVFGHTLGDRDCSHNRLLAKLNCSIKITNS
jgi:vacuolar-type H+-ATPase subunit E/Vma4